MKNKSKRMKLKLISILLLSVLIGLMYSNIPKNNLVFQRNKVSDLVYTNNIKKITNIKNPENQNDDKYKIIEDKRKRFQYFLDNHPFNKRPNYSKEELKSIPKKDRPDLAYEQDYLRTLDPALGYVPWEKRLQAFKETDTKMKNPNKSGISNVEWTERGPNNVGGRTRALMFDPNDSNNKKVWAGGVAGGLWYNNDITDANSKWQSIDDFWPNIAISGIAYDPTDPDTMYVGTGEGYWNADAVNGAGIWKTTDGGTNWTQLSATNPGIYNGSGSEFCEVQKIVVNSSGDIFAATRGYYTNRGGIQRSTDGGTTWTTVLSPYRGIGVPANISIYDRAADLEIAANGDLYATIGIFSTGKIYRSTDNGTTWTDITPAASGQRIEIAIDISSTVTNTTVIYAVAQGGSGSTDVQWFYKSLTGGNSWLPVTTPTYVNQNCTMSSDHFTRGQAWYDLILMIHPSDNNLVVAGGIDLHRTTDGGANWSPVSYWTGNCYSKVHADLHAIAFRPGAANEMIFGSDGGVHYSANCGNSAAIPVFQNRNNGYNTVQFYSCASENTSGKSYFLGGTQDNGSNQLTNAGSGPSFEVTGGDGAFCFVDQNNANTQITSYVYNVYYQSLDGGKSFVTVVNDQTRGNFINQCDFDNTANILYSAGNNDELIRNSGFGTVTITRVNIGSALYGTSQISAIEANSNTANRIFAGTENGRVFRIDNANGTPTTTRIDNGTTPITATGTISSIDIGSNDNTILVTYSNYGVRSVWYTTDGGTNWTSKDETSYGLPDMPVRWCLFNPGNTDQVLLATETGVWSTNDITAANPDWQPTNAGLANVRCDMLKYRASDGLVTVATHGRGLFTSDIFTSIPKAEFTADQTLTYIGMPVTFTDNSNQAISWLWNFGDGNTSTLQNPVHYYASSGKYNISLQINGNALYTETKNSYIHILPNEGTPYTPANGGNFDNPVNFDDFGSQTISGTVNLWQMGTPLNALTTLNSAPNGWKTDLTADIVEAGYKCVLQTPNYNLSAAGTYSLIFKKSMEIVYCNAPFAVQVQYTTDKGKTWTTLGAFGDGLGTNWYNRDPFGACPINTGVLADQQGWTTTIHNQNTIYDISALAGNTNIAFRFVFSADDGWTSAGYLADGFMVDDFEIQGSANSATDDLTVTTNQISSITATAATTGGHVLSNGGSAITERGIVFAVTQNPTTSDTKVIDGSTGTGMYTSNLIELDPNTSYYIRAYAINSNGTAYGQQEVLNTTAPNALCFDGLDDIVRVPNFKDLNRGTGDFTFSAWFRTSSSSYQIIGAKQDPLTGKGWYVRLNNSGFIEFESGNDGTNSIGVLTSTNILNNNRWHHVAAITDASTGKIQLFIDGTLDKEITSGLTFYNCDNIGDFTVGRIDGAGPQGFNGKIDEVRYWNIARIQSEIRDNMHKTTDGNEANLLLYYNFDNKAGYRLDDITKNGGDGTLEGFNWTSSSGWVTSYAPVPYRSSADGNWSTTVAWNNNEVYIPNSAWALVDIVHDIVCNGDYTADKVSVKTNESLEISVDNSLTVNTDLSVNGSLTIKSDANGTGSLIHNNTGIDATVERFLSNTTGEDGQWHYLSSPVTAAPVSLFNTNNFYQYNENADDWWTAADYYYNTTSGWQIPTGNLNVGQGYSYYYYQTTINYTGELNYSFSGYNISVPYTTHPGNAGNGQPYTNYDGWALVGNPFPCAVDWNDVSLSNVNDVVYYYDDANNNYKYFNGAGGTQGDEGITVNGGSRYIPVGQAFFVKTDNSGGGGLGLPNNSREHNTQNFWKDYNPKITPNLLRFYIEVGDYSDETVLYFSEYATDEFDGEYDAYKRYSPNEDVPQIFTYTDENIDVAINTLSEFEESKTVPLGVFINEAGHYSIQITEFTIEGINSYFEDTYLDTVIRITDDFIYEFDWNGGLINNRFILHFNINTPPFVQNEIPDQEEDEFSAYIYTIPENTFSDNDLYETFVYTVSLHNGTSLPDWLHFDSNTLTLYGYTNEPEVLNIKVTATDIASASVSDEFILTIIETVGTQEIIDNGFQIYPNPVSGILNIVATNDSHYSYQFSTLTGKIILSGKSESKIKQINISKFAKGLYILKIFDDDKIIHDKKIIVE